MTVLRAGGGPPRHRRRDPRAVAFPALFKSDHDWDLLGEKEPGLGGRRLYLPRGKDDRRLRLDQRDDLPARQPARLRRLGGRRRDRVVVRRGAPVLQARRGQRARRGRVPRRRRAARRLGEPLACSRWSTRCSRLRSQAGLRADRRPERRPARRGLALPGHAAKRQALLDRRRVPPSGWRTGRTWRCARASSRSASCSRATAPSGSRSSRTEGSRRARRARGDRLRRHLPVARPAHAFGHRPAEELSLLGIPVRENLPVGAQPPGPLHGQRQLPDRPAGAVRHPHAGELRAAREGGPGAARARTSPRPAASSARATDLPAPDVEFHFAAARSSSTRASTRRPTPATRSARC